MYTQVSWEVSNIFADTNKLIVNAYDPRSTRQRWQKGGTRRDRKDRLESGIEQGRVIRMDHNRRGSTLSGTTYKNDEHQKWIFDHV